MKNDDEWKAKNDGQAADGCKGDNINELTAANTELEHIGSK